MNDIIAAISTVGFPIVMCLALMWYAKYSLDGHHAEVKEFTESLNKNTIILQKLCDLLDADTGDLRGGKSDED